MDVHAASRTLAVISEKDRKLRNFPVETNGQALVEAIRMTPGHEHLVMEEGPERVEKNLRYWGNPGVEWWYGILRRFHRDA
jgi:hypothetical protein